MVMADETKGGKKWQHRVTTILGVVTVLVTIVSAIPNFMGLYSELPDVYFDRFSSSVIIPQSIGEKRVRKILQSNGIPDSTFRINLINQGNGFAKEVKVAIEVPGQIMALTSVPSSKDEPIWVDVPNLGFQPNSNKTHITLKNMATTKPLRIEVGYWKASEEKDELVDVFYDAKPATLVSDVGSIKKWQHLKPFRLPLTILGIGLLVIFLWVIIIVLIENKVLRAAIVELFKTIIMESPFSIIFRVLK